MQIKNSHSGRALRKLRAVACIQLLLQTTTPAMLAFSPAMAASTVSTKHSSRHLPALTPAQRAVIESDYISRYHFKIGYILTKEDTLKQVAQHSHISLLTLREINRIKYQKDSDFYQLQAGDWLLVPNWRSPEEAEQALLDCYNLAGRRLGNMSEAELAAAIATPQRHAPDSSSPPTDAQRDDREVAQWLSRAGNIASSSHSSDAATSLALNSLTQATSSGVENWLQQFGHARVQLNVNNHGHLDSSGADLLLPLRDSENVLTFTQLGVHDKDDYTTLNLGLGQRWFDDSQMLGYNGFIDQELRNNHTRIGMGAEYWRDYLKLAGNTYIGLTGWKESKSLEGYEEKPASGFDIRGEGYLPTLPQLGAKLSFEQYFGDDVGLFGKNKRQTDPYAITAGVNYTPVPLVTAGVDYRQGKSGANDARVNLQFNYLFGVPWQTQISADSVDALRTLNGSRLEFVNRNNNMVMQYRKMEMIKLSLPASLHGEASTQQTITATVETKHGLSRIQWNDAALIAAGGSIQPLSKLQYRINLPTRAGNYSLSAIAWDSRGNASNAATTLINVTPSAASEITIASLTPDTTSAPADGTTPITYTLKVTTPTQNSATDLSSYHVRWSNSGAGDLSATETALDANGQAQVSITSTVAGNIDLSAELLTPQNIQADKATDRSAEFTSQYQYLLDAIATDKDSAKADGTDAVVLSTKATKNGTALSDGTVKWTFTYPDGSTKEVPTQTDSDGNVSTPLISSIAGTVNVKAELIDSTNSVQFARTAQVTFTSMAQEIGSVTFSDTQPKFQWSDRSAPLSVEVLNPSGTAIAGEQVTWDISQCSDCSVPAETVTDNNGKIDTTLALSSNASEGDRTIKVCSNTDSSKCATATVTFLAPPAIERYQTLGTSSPNTGNEFNDVRIKGGQIKINATGSTNSIVKYSWTSSSTELPASAGDNQLEQIITLNDNVGGEISLSANAEGLEERKAIFTIANASQWYYLPDGGVFPYDNINSPAQGCHSADAVDNESEMQKIYSAWGDFFQYTTDLNRRDGYGNLPVWINNSRNGNAATLFYFAGNNKGTALAVSERASQAWAVCK